MTQTPEAERDAALALLDAKIETLHPQPGDLLVLSLPDRTPPETAIAAAHFLKERCGDVTVAVLDAGVSLDRLRAGDWAREALAQQRNT